MLGRHQKQQDTYYRIYLMRPLLPPLVLALFGITTLYRTLSYLLPYSYGVFRLIPEHVHVVFKSRLFLL